MRGWALAVAVLLGSAARAAAPPSPEALPIPPVPPRIAEGPDYDRCLDMLNDDPAEADAFAATWAQHGGGEGARHCHALAAVALGNTNDGASALDGLAATSRAPAAARAEIAAQASQAWLAAGDATAAYTSADAAIRLSPDDPELRLDHAGAAIALRRFAAARADLAITLALEPQRADALTLRATAERNEGDLAAAAADIARAVALEPDNPEALLERGIVRQRQGDLAGAQADWTRAEDLDEDSETGDLARQDLALLAAGPKR